MSSYDRYVRYYHDQAGGQLPVFRGAAYQRGHGLGGYASGQSGGGIADFFKGLFRIALPLVKKMGFALGKQTLASGADIINDLETSRQPVRQVFKRRVNEAGDALLHKAATTADKIMQSGKGVKSRTRKKTTQSSAGRKRIKSSSRKKPAVRKTAKKRKSAKKGTRKTLKNKIPQLRDIFAH